LDRSNVPTKDGGIAETKLRDDVGAHALGRGCRVGVHAGAGKALFQFCQLAVLRAKVVAPVADAMRFINGKRAHLNSLEQTQETVGQQPLRRHKQKAISPANHLFFRLSQRVRDHAAV
jgi:hypothetical protein